MSLDLSPGESNDVEDWQPHDDLLYDQSVAVAKPHVNQSELLCRTGCGFYGYPSWQGHCSKCYKEMQTRNTALSGLSSRNYKISRPVFDPTNIKNKVSRSVSDVSDLSGRASLLINKKIDKLEEKRKQQVQKNQNIVKNIFKKTSLKAAEEPTSTTKGKHNEVVSPTQEFDGFLKKLSKEGGGAVKKQVTLSIERIKKLVHTHPLEELADNIQELYSNVHNMVTTHTAFAGMSSESVSRLCSLTECFVMSQLHPLLFAVVNAHCEERDLDIQKRIRSLSWLTPEHIGCKLSDTDNSDALDTIIEELLEIDGKVIPSEKLSILVNCSHEILRTLSSNSNAPASADDFLPALILCLIRANPPMLHSNLDYITHFAPQSQLQSGEKGYYFTNLCCAVAFIEKVCGASVGLTEQEFNRHMSGKALHPNPKLPESVTALENSLLRFNKAVTKLDEIQSSYVDVMDEVIQIEKEVIEKVSNSCSSHPLTLRTPHTMEDMRRLIQCKEEVVTREADSALIPHDNTLPECEEAYNLYYSLTENGSSSILDAPVTDGPSLPSLLDEPNPPEGPQPLLSTFEGEGIDTSVPSQHYFGTFDSIPSIPCGLGSQNTSLVNSSLLESAFDSSTKVDNTLLDQTDCFSPPHHSKAENLPLPLIPVKLEDKKPCVVNTEALMSDYMAALEEEEDSAKGGEDAKPLDSEDSVVDGVLRQGDTLEKVVDVLAGIADKVDEFL